MNVTPTTILLASDGDPPTATAARAASDLARWFDATLYVVHVTPATAAPVGTGRPAYCALARAVAGCTVAGATVTRANERTGDPEAEIFAEAAEVGADLIIIGRCAGCPVGALATQLARRALCPILIVRDGDPGWPPIAIVIGDDGSIEARNASVLGAILGGAAGADGLLIRAVPPFDNEEQRHAESQLLSRAAKLHALFGQHAAVEISSDPPDTALLDAADAVPGPVLIVIGTCGTGAMGRRWLGSVADKVLAHAAVSVLLCPPHHLSAGATACGAEPDEGHPARRCAGTLAAQGNGAT